MTPRSEPLLWLQLIALGAIPLELLLLLLVLAGADPGPLPGLERLLVWGLGVLGPLLLLWRQPPDCCSLLLAQVPLRGRTSEQLKLSALQDALLPRLLGVLGGVALLPLLWSLDNHAALAAAFSPLASSNRLVGLLLAIPLLAVLVWQWQQVVQALWLLSRNAIELDAAIAMDLKTVGERRLSLGLPLLLLNPLRHPELPAATLAERAGPGDSVGAVVGEGNPVPIEPEQPAEEAEGPQLDEQIG